MSIKKLSRLLPVIALAFAGMACAQDYPVKPVRMVVPFPPGALTDALARLVAEKLQAKWGQPVIVENRAGAAGNLGAELVARAEPDGYTLMFAPPGPLFLNKHLYSKLAYDPEQFVPISLLVTGPVALVVNSAVPATSLQQLIALAKASPGRLNYASGGSGNTTHLAAELFNSMAGVNTVHVPYQGIAPAITALLGAQTDMMFVDLGAAMPNIRAGKLRALAVGGERRTDLLPGVPTLDETLPGFVAMGWLAMAAPPRTPPSVTGRISTAVAESLRLPDVARRVQEMSFDNVGSSPAELAKFIGQENQRWGKLIRALGITVN